MQWFDELLAYPCIASYAVAESNTHCMARSYPLCVNHTHSMQFLIEKKMAIKAVYKLTQQIDYFSYFHDIFNVDSTMQDLCGG